MSSPESVSIEDRERKARAPPSEKISFRFFSPPGKSLVDRALHQRVVDLHDLALLLHQTQEVEGVDLGEPAMLADGVEGARRK